MSDRTLIDAAKASVIAYNEKNWDAVRRTVTPGIVYDEVATNRRAEGIENVLMLWKGWAAALPDSNATFENAYASDDAVVLELTWRGQHTGVLRTDAGEIPPTGRRIELRACQIVGIADGKTRSVRHYFDMATLQAQLGIATAGAPAAVKAAGA